MLQPGMLHNMLHYATFLLVDVVLLHESLAPCHLHKSALQQGITATI